MNGLPYYKAYPRDFFEGTIGMDFEVKAAYRLILDMIYMHGGRLVDDGRFISGLLGCSGKKWAALRSAVLATGKITVENGYLANHRADKVIDEAKMFQSKQRDNRAGSSKNKDLAATVVKPKPDHTDTDTDTEEVNTSSDGKPSDPVKIMFDSGVALLAASGMKDRPARAMLGKWRSEHGTEAVITALGRAQREGAIDPVAYCQGVFKSKPKEEIPVGSQRMGADGKMREYNGNGKWLEVLGE